MLAFLLALARSLIVDKQLIIRKYTFQLSLQDAYNLPFFLKQYFKIKPLISSKYCLHHFEQGFCNSQNKIMAYISFGEDQIHCRKNMSCTGIVFRQMKLSSQIFKKIRTQKLHLFFTIPFICMQINMYIFHGRKEQ